MNLAMSPLISVQAPKIATSTGIRPRSLLDEASAASGMSAASAVARVGIGFGGLFEAWLDMVGGELAGGVAGSGSGEARAIDAAFASEAAARAVPPGPATGGKPTIGPSFLLICAGNSAWASATGRCEAVSGCGARGFAGGKML